VVRLEIELSLRLEYYFYIGRLFQYCIDLQLDRMAEDGKPTDFNFSSQGVQVSKAPSRAEVPPTDSTLGAIRGTDTDIPGETKARDPPEYLEEASLDDVTLRPQREVTLEL